MSTKSALYLPPQNEEQLVVAWIRRARESQLCHYEMADIYSNRDRRLGIPVVLINALIGTSVFASITAEAVSSYEKISVGMLSVVAAVLASRLGGEGSEHPGQ